MKIEFDPLKSEQNAALRGIGFDAAAGFSWETALYHQDTRKDYGEERFNALGYIGNRLHSMTFTKRGDTLRIISLRRANEREQRKYQEATS